MFLSKASAYALKTMLYITSKLQQYCQENPKLNINNVHFFSHELAKECKIPHNYLSKVLRQLVRTGVLYAATGQKGGYGLRKKPDDIYLHKIVEPFENIRELSQCFFGLPFCTLLDIGKKTQSKECPLYLIVKKTTLSSLVNKIISDKKVCNIIFEKVKMCCA